MGSYSGYAASIRSKCSSLASVASSINSLNLGGTWKGAAAQTLVTSLEGVVSKINSEKGNLEGFASTIARIDELIAIDEKIEKLEAELGGLDPEDEDEADRIGAIQSELTVLREKRTVLVAQINGALSGFGSTASEFSMSFTGISTAKELSYDDAVVLAKKLQVPVEYILSLHLHEGYELGDRLIPEGITPDVIHYAGEHGFPILIDGIKDLGDKYRADATERDTYFIKTADNFSVVNGGSEYQIQGWPITFSETEGRDIYWTYYGPISQGAVLNKTAAPIQCTDTDLFPCDDGHYRDKDGYIVIAGSPYVNQFYDGVHVDYEANGGMNYEDMFVVTPFGLGRFYDNGAIQVKGGIECDFYINDGYESNNIAKTEYGKRLRESAVEGYESLNLYWNQMIH